MYGEKCYRFFPAMVMKIVVLSGMNREGEIIMIYFIF
jgi:hypothetical protein